MPAMNDAAHDSTLCAGNHPPPADWLPAGDFARLVGISTDVARRVLRDCHSGKRWRGVELLVRKAPSPGGPKGLRYEVAAASLPSEIVPQARAVLVPAGEGPSHDLEPWKLAAVQSVRRAGKPGSAERAAAVRKLAAELSYPDGRKRGKPVSERTIRAWVKEYESGGYAALSRKGRADAGSRRVTVSRAWDRAAAEAGLDGAARQMVLERLEQAIKEEFKAGGSWQTVQLNVTPVLCRASTQAGMTIPAGVAFDLCKVPRNVIERFRPYKAVNIYRRDAGLSAAIQTPRVTRDRSHLAPMEWVAGDVHHIDIAFQRADGSLCTIKAIAWLDLATNRLFVTPVLLEKGAGVRREHVLRSFADMCADPSWGVPSRLYLDNGSEYALLDELTRDLLKLKELAGRAVDVRALEDLEPGVQKAKPYNPQAKVIETTFAILEKKVLPQLPGHMGGNRMKKKTENQGKAPVPYDGDFESFAHDLRLSLDYYHRAPQHGHLNGKSPNDRFAHWISHGWQSVTLDRQQLEIAFSKIVTRKVHAGGVFSIDGRKYRDDALLSLGGTGRITVRVPLIGRGDVVYAFDDEDKLLCAALRAPVFAFGDPAGAKEQQRQARELRHQMAAMGGVRRDGRDAMRDVVAMTPEPAVASAGLISINEDFQEAARNAGALPIGPSADADHEQRRGVSEALAKLAERTRGKRAAGG